MTTPSDNSARLSGGSRERKHLAKNSQTAMLVTSSSSAIVAVDGCYYCIKTGQPALLMVTAY
jgi:hypothetical protein